MSSYREKNSSSISLVDGNISDGNLSGLNELFNAAEWKTQVSIALADLERRVAALEQKNNFSENFKQTFSDNPIDFGRAESFSASGKYGISGIPTCAHLVLTKRVAKLQFSWLLICIFTFLFIAIHQFMRARWNVEATWKPEKIDHIKDYISGDVTEQYEMPVIDIFFEITAIEGSTTLSEQLIDKTISKMLASQDFNSTSMIEYLTPELDTVDAYLHCRRSDVFPMGSIRNNSAMGFFLLQLSNPDPRRGSFHYWIYFDTVAITLNNTVNLTGFWVSVGRDRSRANMGNLAYAPLDEALHKGKTVVSVVDYDESVHYKWDKEDPTYYFETSSGWQQDPMREWPFEGPGVYILLRGNLMVKHWREYVDFSYYDWLAAMGGLLSIYTVCFFFVGHQIAKKLSVGHSIGILPGLSVTFRNLEMLSWLRAQLATKNISPRSSYR